MYNKLFTKILDSSIWLESHATVRVWITLLAAMDEDGFCQFASVGNLAHRAMVTPEECNAAVTVLTNADPNSSDTDHDGRRVLRVDGGWVVLNAGKYNAMVTREKSKEANRLRVERHRKRKAGNASVTPGNGSVAQSDVSSDVSSGSVVGVVVVRDFSSEERAQIVAKCIRLRAGFPPRDLDQSEVVIVWKLGTMWNDDVITEGEAVDVIESMKGNRKVESPVRYIKGAFRNKLNERGECFDSLFDNTQYPPERPVETSAT